MRSREAMPGVTPNGQPDKPWDLNRPRTLLTPFGTATAPEPSEVSFDPRKFGGPKFPQCEPTRRIRRRGGPPVRSGRYPDRGVCGGYSGVRRRVWLAPDRRELDRRRNTAV